MKLNNINRIRKGNICPKGNSKRCQSSRVLVRGIFSPRITQEFTAWNRLLKTRALIGRKLKKPVFLYMIDFIFSIVFKGYLMKDIRKHFFLMNLYFKKRWTVALWPRGMPPPHRIWGLSACQNFPRWRLVRFRSQLTQIVRHISKMTTPLMTMPVVQITVTPALPPLACTGKCKIFVSEKFGLYGLIECLA
jgi:hypothetical protein